MQSIGPKGFIELTTAQTGAARKLRVCAFTGRATVGTCDNPGFRSSDALAAVVDMTKGRVVTGSFGSLANGTITESDTGGLGSDGAFTGHELLR